MLKKQFVTACVLSATTATQGGQLVPTQIAHLYDVVPDQSVSDDFDQPTLDSAKWGYRTQPTAGNWLASNVSIQSNGTDQYLSLYGGWDRSPGADGVIRGTGSSSGVYSRNHIGFGFYTTRWRV